LRVEGYFPLFFPEARKIAEVDADVCYSYTAVTGIVTDVRYDEKGGTWALNTILGQGAATALRDIAKGGIDCAALFDKKGGRFTVVVTGKGKMPELLNSTSFMRPEQAEETWAFDTKLPVIAKRALVEVRKGKAVFAVNLEDTGEFTALVRKENGTPDMPDNPVRDQTGEPQDGTEEVIIIGWPESIGELEDKRERTPC